MNNEKEYILTFYTTKSRNVGAFRATLEECIKTSSKLFKYVENRFFNWIKGNNEYNEMYFGCEAIFNKKDAIIQAIEDNWHEWENDNKTFIAFKELESTDFEASFE